MKTFEALLPSAVVLAAFVLIMVSIVRSSNQRQSFDGKRDRDRDAAPGVDEPDS